MSEGDDRNGEPDDVDDAADAALMTELRAAADAHDPVPSHLIEFARLAPQLRRMDDQLAELLDSSELAGVRHDDADRLMSFASSDTSIDIDVTDGRIVGHLIPGSVAAVVLECPDGTIEETTSDERGHFSFAIAHGSMRIVAGVDATTSTEWFVL